MRNKRLAALGLTLLLGFIPGLARASGPNYCFPFHNPDYCWSSMKILENMAARFLADVGIGILKGLAIVLWIVDRAAAFVFSKTVTDNAWLLALKDQMLNLLTGIMPGMLREVAFGGSGIMYVALALSGLVMMLPMLGLGARLVRPERVMLWGVLLSLLFVSGSFGYDFISAFEGFRQGMVERIAQGGSAMPLDKLLLYPMRAGDGDLGLTEDMARLPMIFDSSYFPAPQLIEVTISEGGVLGLGNANVERLEDIAERFEKAMTGAFYAVISLFGAYLLIIVGLTYALLTFTALILMLFLFAALPLGFFEIGGQLLLGIVQRYFEVFVQSLSLVVFLRWLSDGLGGAASPNTVSGSLLWLVMVVLMIVVAHVFFNGALRILLTSGQTIVTAAQSFNSTFGGSSPVEMMGTAMQKTIGNQVATAGNLVAGAAMLAGRPEVAAAASIASGMGRSMANSSQQQRPLAGYGLGGGSVETGQSESGQPQRGNVFVNDGSEDRPPDPASSTMYVGAFRDSHPARSSAPSAQPGGALPGGNSRLPRSAPAVIPVPGNGPRPSPARPESEWQEGERLDAPPNRDANLVGSQQAQRVTHSGRAQPGFNQRVPQPGAAQPDFPPDESRPGASQAEAPQPAAATAGATQAIPPTPPAPAASEDLRKAVKSARTMTYEQPRKRI